LTSLPAPTILGFRIAVSLMKKTLPLIAVLAMAILHQDFWFWRDSTLVFGVLPIGLFYHACYTVAAAALMWVLARYAWPAHLEKEAERPQPGSKRSEF
jgi:hypothetical protein